jgi:chromosome segregation ATPase
MAAFDANAFNVILQEFGEKKNRLLPLITQYVQSTRNFSGELTELVTIVTQKIGLINARVRGLNDQVQQLNQRIVELQQELANHPAPAEVQRLQQELAAVTQAKNQLEGLLETVRQQLVEFNQTVTAAPYDTLTADSIRQLNEALANIITSLTEADRTLSASLGVPQGRGPPPPGRGGKRKTKRRNKRSKKHLKKKSKTVKKGKKMRGGYSYGKAKRRYKSRSSSSIPSSLSSASKNIILF